MTSDDLQFHAFCLTQTGTRLDEYARAIASHVESGHTVVDLGSGSGILAFLACLAGARRVYAIEASEALSFGELLASVGGFRDRIEFIRSRGPRVARQGSSHAPAVSAPPRSLREIAVAVSAPSSHRVHANGKQRGAIWREGG